MAAHGPGSRKGVGQHHECVYAAARMGHVGCQTLTAVCLWWLQMAVANKVVIMSTNEGFILRWTPGVDLESAWLAVVLARLSSRPHHHFRACLARLLSPQPCA